jgi:dTMP kinase
MSGVFLTLEGPEGAGKTTQIARLSDALTDRGERVRALLLDRDAAPIPIAELLLFGAARAQNVQTVVRPALDSGHVVLCDRFTDSTLAYQGYGRGLPLETIRTVNAVATDGLIPHRTFLLDLPPQIGLARQSPDAQDRLDRETLDFHEKVRAGFLAVAASEPERIVTLDATQNGDALFADLLAAVLPLLPQP